jgi:hypothetical protein
MQHTLLTRTRTPCCPLAAMRVLTLLMMHCAGLTARCAMTQCTQWTAQRCRTGAWMQDRAGASAAAAQLLQLWRAADAAAQPARSRLHGAAACRAQLCYLQHLVGAGTANRVVGLQSQQQQLLTAAAAVAAPAAAAAAVAIRTPSSTGSIGAHLSSCCCPSWCMASLAGVILVLRLPGCLQLLVAMTATAVPRSLTTCKFAPCLNG